MIRNINSIIETNPMNNPKKKNQILQTKEGI